MIATHGVDASRKRTSRNTPVQVPRMRANVLDHLSLDGDSICLVVCHESCHHAHGHGHDRTQEGLLNV